MHTRVHVCMYAETWPLLVNASVPFSSGTTSQAVAAVQDALTVNGYATPITSTFDAETVQSLKLFQAARGSAVISGTLVDDQVLLPAGTQSFGPIEKIVMFFVTSACARRTGTAARVERRRRER